MSKARTLADFISDGSEFADGTISVAEVSGAAPLASPTFTGNATFDTNTLYVDGTNNRVGFGTTSPARSVTIFENDQPVFQITNNTSGTANTRGLIQYIANGTTDAVFDNQGSGSGGMFRFMQAGTERLRMTTSAFITNEGGNDYDFRVESDNNANCLFVDASTDRVGINTGSPANPLDIRYGLGTAYTGTAQSAEHIYIFNTASGVAGLTSGIRYQTRAADQTGQAFFAGAVSSSGGYAPSYVFQQQVSAAGYRELMAFTQSEAVFNNPSNNYDFRVESDGNTHALFVDAAQSTVGVGTSSTFQTLTVNGNIAVGGAGNKGIYFGDNITGSADQEWLLANNASSSNSFILYEYDSGTYVSQRVEFLSGGNTRFDNGNGTTLVINEAGNDADFRVESDSNTHRLFVDASADCVTIGSSNSNSAYGLVVRNAKRSALFFKDSSNDGDIMQEITWDTSGYAYKVFVGSSGAGYSTNNAVMWVPRSNSTSRSINASGTINASGADYAEYMVKADTSATINKGDVCGIDANGNLTTVWTDAISFVVKSTDPSYVGGDTWFNGELPPDEDAPQSEKDDYEARKEAARATVDRIAFSGQVPVNVTGATVGDFIIPVQDGTGITGQAVSTPTFDQYMAAVGKVIAIEDDGRAKIIVKVA